MRSVTLAGRLTIIGGGVMGLMTAYQAAPLAEAVTVLDRSWVGDPATASFGLTRSVRNDYRDPQYARLAVEARRQLALQRGTVYDIRRFTPARFAAHEEEVA
jgi:glycine/D-amino acid oxidase-like deaminating enzyme